MPELLKSCWQRRAVLVSGQRYCAACGDACASANEPVANAQPPW